MSKRVLAGVEVSARELVLGYSIEEGPVRQRRFENSARGHQGIVNLITKKKRQARVCLESTGTYGLDLTLALSGSEGVSVMQANPRQVRRFGEARGQRQKTDALDAELLVEYARVMPFKPWKRPSEPALRLHKVSRSISALTETLVAEKNRRHAMAQTEVTPDAVSAVSERLIQTLEDSLEELREEALRTIESDTKLKRRFEILDSVKGIGKRAAINILGELCVLPEDMGPKQWVALAGLAPRVKQSGSSINKRIGIGRAGNKHLRKALIMPAMAMRRFLPEMKALSERLVGRGLKPIQAIIAIMRKSLHLIYALFSQDRLFLITPPQAKHA